MSTDRRAVNWQVINWVNALRPSNKPYPLAIYENVMENVDGRVLVKIYTNRFHTRDTMGEMLKLVQAQFGQTTSSKSEGKLTTYEWQLCSTRWVQLIHRQGIGTFIQLIDSGEQHGDSQEPSIDG